MIKLRLKRIGKKKNAFYRIVAINNKKKRNGEYIELLGTYNPINGKIQINNYDIIYKWLKIGAQPTKTVKNLLSKTGILFTLHNQKNNINKNN